jgi:hypothetical protein
LLHCSIGGRKNPMTGSGTPDGGTNDRETTMTKQTWTRRTALKAGVGGLAATALTAPAVHGQPRTVLRCGFWDHWVPAGNGALRELCAAWGQRERVDVQVDFITSVGNQIQLTIAAEAQSRSGHDILSHPTWFPAAYADQLVPVDDVMGRLAAKYGAVTPAAEYLAKREGKWVAVPAVSGTQMKPCLGRIDLLKQHAGLDPREMWPAEDRAGPGANGWTWDAFLAAAEKCDGHAERCRRLGGRAVHQLRRLDARCRGQGDGQEQPEAARGGRLHGQAREVPAQRRVGVGRCEQQSRHRQRALGADLQPALRLCGRAARQHGRP